MPMPRRYHVKLVARVPEEFRDQVAKEAAERKMTVGALVQEAFASRMRLIRKAEKM